MPLQRWTRVVLIAALLVSIATLAGWIFSQCSDFQVQDDGFMFARYARNLLDTGRISWNPGGPPTYGATSILYLAVITPMLEFFGGNVSSATVLSSLFAGIAAAIVIARLALATHGETRVSRAWLAALALVPIAMAGEHVAAHFTNGMDTTFAMAMLGVFILFWTHAERVGAHAGGVVLGLVGGLLFAARPDLGLFALGVPLIVALATRGPSRRRAWIAAAVSLAWIAAQSFGAWAYFGTPVPLSFYLKGLDGAYGPAFRAKYAHEPLIQLSNFTKSYWIFAALIAADLALNRRELLRPERALRTALSLAVLAHVGYYTLGVLQVVGFHQRFYYPVLPALVYLAAKAVVDLWRFARLRGGRVNPRAEFVLALAAFCGPISSLWHGSQTLAAELRAHTPLHFNLVERYRRHPRAAHFWLALDRLGALSHDLVVATTEVGHPAVLLPNQRVIDLAGLNDTQIALHGFSAAKLFADGGPDWIYLPHRDYEAMNRELRSDPIFQRDFAVFEAETLPADAMGVALKRTSPYFAELSAVLEAARAAR